MNLRESFRQVLGVKHKPIKHKIMITGIYVWLSYTKPSGSKSSKLDWVGTIDVDKAISAVNKITAKDMLRKQSSKFFSHDVTLSISIQEIKSGEVLYRRTL